MRKHLEMYIHEELPHGHGGVVHLREQDWNNGSPCSHAYDILKNIHDLDGQRSNEVNLQIIDALVHIVLELIDHTKMPTKCNKTH